MTPLLKKLNYKDQKEVIIFDAPEELNDEVKAMENYVNVKVNPIPKAFDFMLSFLSSVDHVNALAENWSNHAQGDAIMWCCYPKKSSKKYKSDITRDNGWQVLGDYGWEPVRQIAINDDWSALRFRKVTYIKTMTRSFAMSAEGKEKSGK